MDQTVSNYTCQRKTRRWPGVLWYKVLDVARLIAYTNSCHIWRGTRMAHTNSRSILLKRREPPPSSKRTSHRRATGRARGAWCAQKSGSWGSQCTSSTNTLWSFVWNVIRCDGMCVEMTNMIQIWNEKTDSPLKELLETNSNCKSNLDEPCVVTWRVFIHKVGKKKLNEWSTTRNTPSPARAVWWKRKAVEALRNHRPMGSLKVQGNRNGDEYHQVMEDLVLNIFLIQNHKTIDCIGIVSSVPDATLWSQRWHTTMCWRYCDTDPDSVWLHFCVFFYDSFSGCLTSVSLNTDDCEWNAAINYRQWYSWELKAEGRDQMGHLLKMMFDSHLERALCRDIVWIQYAYACLWF